MRRSWFGTVVKQNKSPSLDLLKSLYSVLVKNSIVTDNNKTLIVEVLRSIAETVIWGDQNDPRVFDFFLEKGIQSYFLSIIEQPKCGAYVCTQLLQTLNILFENIRNETSIYFLLSNNHVNSVICHEFDFSDEEIMAYYISFLKTLSLKLNSNTIHFFYNEHLRDFPLYTEAIKFFNHNESMVRIAVRTLTLNVYQVGDEAIIKFIHDKTAAPYFSNLVWFIGNNVLMMERCLRTEATHLTRNKLESLVALHLDDMHYVHDIMLLQMQSLNSMLCEHLLNTLLIPLYVYSLDPSLKVDSPQVSVKCALFLLSQVFLILTHPPLVKQLKLYICFEENPNLESSDTLRRFTKPSHRIQETFNPAVIPKNKQNLQPTRLAKEHKQELKEREAKRLQEESRMKDLEKYQKKQTFSQTGYLKSILDPDAGIDPLLGTKVHRVASLKNSSVPGDARSRESSTVSKESSAYSEAVYVDSENSENSENSSRTESFIDILDPPSTSSLVPQLDPPSTSSLVPQLDSTSSTTTPDVLDGFSTPDNYKNTPETSHVIPDENHVEDHVTDREVLEEPGNEAGNMEYPVSEDSGIVSSETMENIAQDIEDVVAAENQDPAHNNNAHDQSHDVSHDVRSQSPNLESDSTLSHSASLETEPRSVDTDTAVQGNSSVTTAEFRSPEPESPTLQPPSPSPSGNSVENGAFQSEKVLAPLSTTTTEEEQSSTSNTQDNNHTDKAGDKAEDKAGTRTGNSADKPVTDEDKTQYSDNDTTITLSDVEIQDVNQTLKDVNKELSSEPPTRPATPPKLPTTASAEDLFFTPTKTSDTSHFADAFHCPPTRSCIFYDALLSCLELGEDDVEALFSAALLYAMFTNKSMPHRPPAPYYYDDRIVDRLLNLLDKSCHVDGCVRLVTVELADRLLRVLTTYENRVLLHDNHLAVLTAVKENSVRFLRNFYTGEDNTLFVELFDEEFKAFNKRRPTNVAHLMGDECMLLGPVYTPLTGIDFTKRLPCGDFEKMRKSLMVFFTIRRLWLEAVGQEEQELPLLNLSLQVTKGDILNLNHSDLIACAVISENDVGFASMLLSNMRSPVKRFLVIDTHQLILVEPDNAPGRLGYGIVQFVAPLQCVDARPDKDNNRNLLVTIEKSGSNNFSFRAKFQFEDHIRCFAAKTRLKQGRESLQKLKGFKLSHVLDMPGRIPEEPFLGNSRVTSTALKKGPNIGKSKAEKSNVSIPKLPTSPESSAASSVSGSEKSHDVTPRDVTSLSNSRRKGGSTSGSSSGTPSSPRKSLAKLPDPEVV
ncbi:protein CLEC16A-like isoform X3 [Bolinopsis microptera]|uniref:protein CLEC16A-like isoform X3 n=1 Tax=Bolinopsis microptera TaxID=2820187 RepID=UPI003079579B